MSIENERPHLSKGDEVIGLEGQIFQIQDKIGEGRCAVVYQTENLKTKEQVALKVYNLGRKYEGALQRELSVLDTLQKIGQETNTVIFHNQFDYLNHHCLVLELLDDNIRHILFKNNKQGFHPWGIQKFARDIFRASASLHKEGLVHADLKPANIHWCSQHGCYKLLDFGLSFHTSEEDVHQVQSTGYQAPEVKRWNRYKQSQLNRQRIQSSNESSTLHKNNHKAKSPAIICHCNPLRLYGDINKLDKPLSEFNDLKNIGPQFGSESCTTKLAQENKQTTIPEKPTTAIDIWSIGCLLVEVTTGRKFLKDDTLVCCEEVCHICQKCPFYKQLDLAITEAAQQHDNGLDDTANLAVLRDLLHKCLDCNDKTRISAEEALQHPFLQLSIEPTIEDCCLMPTRVIQLINVTEDILDEVMEELQTCGRIVNCLKALKGQITENIFILFEKSSDSYNAWKHISKCTFKRRTIVTTFYPLENFNLMSENSSLQEDGWRILYLLVNKLN